MRIEGPSSLPAATASRHSRMLGRPSPDYKVRSTGPDHDKVFFATVLVAKERLGQGEGRSKKAAEQAAAAEAFARLTDDT